MTQSITFGKGLAIMILVTFFVCAGYVYAFKRVRTMHLPVPMEGTIKFPPLRTIQKTNSWFSSAYSFPSEPLFAYPGAYKITGNGLELSTPTLRSTEKLVAAGFVSECQISRGVPVTSARVTGYGDWNVRTELSDSLGAWTVHLAMGSPEVYLTDVGSSLQVTCPQLSDDGNQAILFVSNELHGYLVEGRNGTREGMTVHSPTGEYRVSLIQRESSAQAFVMDTPIDWSPIMDTKVSWTINEGAKQISTTYSMVTPAKTQATFIRLPHMGTDPVDAGAVVPTVLGIATKHTGTDFTVSAPLPSLPFGFDPVQDPSERSEIITEIRRDAASMIADTNIPAGVYFKGTWIGALTTLTQLADAYELSDISPALHAKLTQVMRESLPLFSYDETTHLLIAKNAEFGNEKGNDHHFHYGYYIRAAAVLTKNNPELRAEFSPVISELIADIANTDRTSTKYPFLRMYSPYEGHSWADGQGKFADGNNQESTSEALNAWYAIKLWGEVSGDQKIKETGEWLFSQELAGTKSYWFAQDNPFPTGYSKPMASLVWGGKREYATWFSAQPMHIVGIQLLPITPASKYLATITTLPDTFAATAKDVKTPYSHEWGDLFAVAQTLATGRRSVDPARIKSTAGLKLRSLLLHELYSVSP